MNGIRTMDVFNSSDEFLSTTKSKQELSGARSRQILQNLIKLKSIFPIIATIQCEDVLFLLQD